MDQNLKIALAKSYRDADLRAADRRRTMDRAQVETHPGTRPARHAAAAGVRRLLLGIG